MDASDSTVMPAYASPRKTARGAQLLARHDRALTAAQRRLLLLVDGERTVADLIALFPAEDIPAALAGLQTRALVEHGPLQVDADPQPAQWHDALDFMRACARTYLGIGAAEVFTALDHARDSPSLHHATRLWYRALRESRGGRPLADRARIHAAHLLHDKAA